MQSSKGTDRAFRRSISTRGKQSLLFFSYAQQKQALIWIQGLVSEPWKAARLALLTVAVMW
jgi:hypothetical protein